MLKKNASYILHIAVVISFLILFSLLVMVYLNIAEKHKLEMKFNSEKAFNSIYMAMTENMNRAEQVMKEEGVSAIGLYSVNGQLFRGLGSPPQFLPLNSLVSHHIKGDDSRLGIYIYNEDTEEIEYFRLSRLNVILETGTLRFDKNGNILEPFPEDIAEILYIKFNGSTYFRNLNRSKLLILFGAILLILLLVLIIIVFRANKKYKDRIIRTEQLASLGTAARTLAHEIKNPLSSISIQSAILKKIIPDTYKNEIEILDHEVLRIASLTDKVTEFLKQPVGKPEKIDLIEFLISMNQLFGKKLTENFNNIEYVSILFDKDRLRSVFENLIKNALESTQSSDSRDPKVEVNLKIKKKNICIFIVDHGDGIPFSIRDKLFDPFCTTKINGSGIGLSITKQFLEAQNSNLKILKTDIHGTIIEVSIPYIEVKKQEYESTDN